jgi:multidrug efflux pump subunit AcrA (membrane-fusion protein)
MSKYDILNAQVELNAIAQEYNEKTMKAESDKFSALSAMYDAEAGLTKMQNQLTNYNIRNGYYYVTAPQDGFVTQTFVQESAISIKEGAPLISFVPDSSDLSVELYVEPMDLPLISKGISTQLTFDGWPALVFSGWPGMSTGTYTARVVAIDKVISPEWQVQDPGRESTNHWPSAIQVGTGVKAIALLNKVPLIYEIWSKINGFPPQFYKAAQKQPDKDDKKKK